MTLQAALVEVPLVDISIGDRADLAFSRHRRTSLGEWAWRIGMHASPMPSASVVFDSPFSDRRWLRGLPSCTETEGKEHAEWANCGD